jgi:hypothetical protein
MYGYARAELVQQATIDAIMILYYFQPQSTSIMSEEIYEMFLARRKSTCQETNRTRNLSDPVCLSFPPVKPLDRSTSGIKEEPSMPMQITFSSSRGRSITSRHNVTMCT